MPEAISTLIEGGMRVWMITGDKQVRLGFWVLRGDPTFHLHDVP